MLYSEIQLSRDNELLLVAHTIVFLVTFLSQHNNVKTPYFFMHIQCDVSSPLQIVRPL